MITRLCLLSVNGQQIDIDRIEMMPNMPSPYEMRNWKKVALGYDSLVFDFDRIGQYLPLIWWNPNPINYPEHSSFGLETVVGTPRLYHGEAINVIPAVVGASLIGVDKSNQNGYNWVLMCEEFFNRRSEENIYLNNYYGRSGRDWWYDTMPNVFFYQLYDLYRQYGSIGEFAYQFKTVAEQWLKAVEGLGGGITPWNIPYMNYRGWSFSTMTPGSTEWPEPESAGAIAWLLYNAYVETGKDKYCIGAELSMEFLNEWLINPSYELQMPYGAYIAARMNAELGTSYDIEKMVNWCFDLTTYRGNWYNDWGYVDGWGAIIGNWGGYDVCGLIGELSNNDYAFLMNGFEKVGALAPMVRYDDRFSRAIGKWVLNVSNASRLFYPNYLPPENQDSEAWSYQYDPNSCIGHEAIRENLYDQSPYASGDAIKGGWGYTNLTLYGSSHVGILGGIIDTTNVKMILRLDLLKTDYFQNMAYPTFLYFNPYTNNQTVDIDVGDGTHDLYDAVSNNFLSTGVSGVISINIPGDQAVQVVITPSDGNISYDLDRMLINGIVIDYRAGQEVSNYPPRIKSIASEMDTLIVEKSTIIYCTAEDKDSDTLNYKWNIEDGMIQEYGAMVNWTAPNMAGNYHVKCEVDDGNGGVDSASLIIHVVDSAIFAIAGNDFISKDIRLYSNYPNPFNPTTTIEFDLPKSSYVTLKIFNILGEEIAMLVSDRLIAGSYSYEWDASNLASGVYLYRFEAGEFVETRKMILMR
jgi:hypothetical protein